MNLIEQQQLQSKWKQNKNRMQHIRKLIDYYYNNQSEYVQDQLNKIFQNNAMKNLIKTYPITERIINDISVMFQDRPVITIQKGLKAQQQLLDNILEDSKFYSVLVTINRLVNLTGKLAVIPKYYNGRILFDIITADRCFVKQVQNFPTQIEQLYYWISPSFNSNIVSRTNRWVRITQTTVSEVEIDSYGNIRKETDIQPNPFGMKLITWFQKQYQYDSFFPDRQQPIVNMNQFYNIHKTFQTVALLYQSYSTLVTKGLSTDANIPFGPQQVLSLPTNPLVGGDQSDAKYISPDTNFDALYKFTDMLQEMAVVYAGLSSDAYKNTSQFQSGWQLELSKLDIINQNKMEQPFYRQSIIELVKMMCKVFSYNDPQKQFKQNLRIIIDFAQLKIKNNPADDWLVWQKQLMHNIITQIDIIKIKNPDLTDTQAEQLYNKNKEINTNTIPVQQEELGQEQVVNQ